MSGIRLDQLLVETGIAESREKAKALIMSGSVFLDGRRMDKPGMAVPADCKPELRGTPIRYVSRGGLKLEKALKTWNFALEGAKAVDIGASTGGFTDCLLQNGAQFVYAADVGYGQLDWKIRSDKRVKTIEKSQM